MSALTHRSVETNGIRMRIAEQGSGPLVLLCHGFPEGWYSWRHQISALAAAGYHVVAPDMRGYGDTDAPEAIDQYTLLHLVGDVVGLLDALGEETAVIVGHDWGASVAWHAARLRPDRFRAVAALSVPFRPRGPERPTSLMRRSEGATFYKLYFQAPGVAEAELDADPRASVRDILLRLSGDVPVTPDLDGGFAMVPDDGGLAGRMAEHAGTELPPWLSEADLDHYASSFAKAGFRGGLNWYRNEDRNWELLRAFAEVKVQVPALYVAGERDLVLGFPGDRDNVANLEASAPLLHDAVLLPGCGHWTQQERPDDVSALLLKFLSAL
ncbi:alpha/beta fold hydrolase [Pimelobacter simplex]|uniref:Epoxide hydrolase n=1 Tax=Nocardioides simplex TaxID=2045 RepID=A0A0A1DJ45_NOCSI|nr:alpha/beta hydrolase [Pimelobacter simplex]AIY16687.1 Epoxide hydrolase [Pimelobacter simplex]MCG8154127.1 alpha/beta fold hydrolase [Pimelobacter simplex]GEB15533.1 epoxide hydrolase [Pimelobacter simplex]SFM58525.1 Pimeloyl-ACP methyl ester carboxylesterase [Pimelobacter simplex]